MEAEAELARLAEATHALSRTLRRTSEIHVGLNPLPGSEFDVMQFVGAHPETSVSTVARALRLQTSNVSTTVRSLVDRGLVERVQDPDDQRRSLLRTSARANEHRRLLSRATARSITTALADLTDDEQEALMAAVPALNRLAEVLVLGG